MSAVLSTDKLRKAFNGKAVVDRVTFSVAGGAAFGILGRNGAGKSTQVKMLTTLLPPTSGTAVVGGYDFGDAGTEGTRRDRLCAASTFGGR